MAEGRSLMNSVISTDPAEGHSYSALNHLLGELRLSAVGMGGLVIDQVSTAMTALLNADDAAAERVLSRESRVNQLEQEIDREAFQIIARHQLVAIDLRLVRAISRVIHDLERVGDEAKKIARFALQLQDREQRRPVLVVASYLRHMANLSASMLRDAVRALDESDALLAQQVTSRDQELDEEFDLALRRVLTQVMEGEPYLRATVNTVFALKGLERIGDHAKNVAEQVMVITGGEFTLKQ
jgi:phosphate transport system protein